MAKVSRRWQPAPRPTGPLDEDYIDGFLYGEEDDVHPILIGACLDQYREEFSHRRPSTVYHVDESINHMLTTLGLHENLALREITRERLMKYKTMMLNGTAPRGLKGRIQKAPTIAKKLGLVKAWLEWATNQGHLDKNPAKGLELPARLVTQAKTKKRGFTDEELSKIIPALKAAGQYVADLGGRPSMSPDHPMRVEWYWCVMCLMFTGARLTEIAQLLRTDVKQIEGVWCVSLLEDDSEDGHKQLKNAPSIRIVPLHSQLVEAGFLDWLHSQPTSDRLFPLLWQAGTQKVSHWFSYFLKKNGWKTPAVSLHSFRHTLTVKLERARTHYSLMRRLLGHSIGNDVESRVYLGSLEYGVKELKEALEAVKFPTG